MRLILVMALASAACAAVEVTVRFEAEVAAVAFLKRVPPRKFIQDAHGPLVFEARQQADAFVCSLEPGDYDLRVRLAGGEVIEGVALAIEKPAAATALTAADIQRINEYVAHMKTFYDAVNVFFIEGWRGRDETGVEGRACVLVECLRHRPYHLTQKQGAAQTVVWRLEKWYFERLGGGWRKCKDFEVLYRQSPEIKAFRRYKWFFCHELAGFRVAADSRDLGAVKLPAVAGLPGRVGIPETGQPAAAEGMQFAPVPEAARLPGGR